MTKNLPDASRLLALCLSLATAPLLRAEEKGESLPPGRTLAGVEVHPRAIHIENRFAYTQILLTGTLDNGERVDVTRMASLVAADDLVVVSDTGMVRPRQDGKGELKYQISDHTVSIPVTVSGFEGDHRVSFIQDVMPAMSRLGCNGGTCHGSMKGKNGFKLSLRGYDPVFDYRALTDDLKGRRFNRADPEKSLFLMKISGRAPHEGGVRAGQGETRYELLKNWVSHGVQLDMKVPRVVSIEAFPRNTVIPLPGMKQQVVVTATFSDGSVRDVTAEAFLESSDTDIMEVGEGGIVTAIRRGEAATLARYEGSYSATQFFVMGDRSGFVWKDPPANNYIDELVHAKLRRIKSLPSDVCSDGEFMRRVYLDLTGLPPKIRDLRIFLSDTRDSRLKRDELIDRLIGSPDFVEHWTNKWSDLLQVNGKFLGDPGVLAFRNWIRQSVASNMPYDQFVYEITNSEGSTLKNPPASYYKILREPDLVMENTTQLFLGIRFNCNKCHDHPFERWTQSNHWQMAAFFAQVGRKDAPGSRKMPRRSATQTAIPALEEIIFDKEEGEAFYPGGEVAAPSFPYNFANFVPPEGTRRLQLSKWLTSKENPYFARSFVNRLWSYFLGVGIIEPVDDIRAGNPPVNPELLDRLTEEFLASGLDTRKLIRLICRSRTYQRSIKTNQWNEDDHINFSHALARRLPAETLYDAIHLVTGSISRLPGMRTGIRAAELPDPSTKLEDGFLDLFGRPPRESACECERSSGMSLGQSLSLINGLTISTAVQDPNNAIADLVRVEKKAAVVIEELYLAIQCRMPTEAEKKALMKVFDYRNLASASTLVPEENKKLLSRFASWEKKQKVVDWIALDTAIHRSKAGATLTKNEDGAILASGKQSEKDTYTIVAWTELTGITGIRLEALTDPSLVKKGPGRAGAGNFVITELAVTAAPASDPAKARAVKLQNATASFSQAKFAVAKAIDGKLDNFGWAIAPQMGKPHQAIFEAKEDFGTPGGTILTITLSQQFPQLSLGKFRLSLTTTKRPVRLASYPAELVKILKIPVEKRTPGQRATLFRTYIDTDPEMVGRIRLNAAQDLAWALINNSAFLFNR